MELLETQDPEKRKLIETSDRHKRELEKEVREITGKTERALTNALIIGGSLALTYFVVSRFKGSKGKKKKARALVSKQTESEDTEEGQEEETSLAATFVPALITQIGSKVIQEASLFLLDLAREKLTEYLQSRKKTNENS